jgi:hypothetical protein
MKLPVVNVVICLIIKLVFLGLLDFTKVMKKI